MSIKFKWVLFTKDTTFKISKFKVIILIVLILSVLYLFMSVSQGYYESSITGKESNLSSASIYKSGSIGVMGDGQNRHSVFMYRSDQDELIFEFYNSISQVLTQINVNGFSAGFNNGSQINHLYSDSTNNSVYGLFTKNQADLYIKKFFIENGKVSYSNEKFLFRHPEFDRLKDSTITVNNINFYGIKVNKEDLRDSLIVEKYQDGFYLKLNKSVYENISGYPLIKSDFTDPFFQITGLLEKETKQKFLPQDVLKIRMFFEMRRFFKSFLNVRNFNEIKNFVGTTILGRLDANKDGFEDLVIQTEGERFINEIVFCYDEKNDSILWRKEYALGIYDWLIEDIDNDKHKEVILSIGAPCCQPAIDYFDKIETAGVTFFPRLEVLDADGKIKIINNKLIKYNLEPKGGFYRTRLCFIPDMKRIIMGHCSNNDFSEKNLLSLDLSKNQIDTLAIKYSNISHISYIEGKIQLVDRAPDHTEFSVLSPDMNYLEKRKIDNDLGIFDLLPLKFNNSTFFFETRFFRIRDLNLNILYSKKIQPSKFCIMDDNTILMLVKDFTENGDVYYRQQVLNLERNFTLKKSALILFGIELLLLLLYFFFRSTLFIPLPDAHKNYITLFTVFGFIHIVKTYGHKNLLVFSKKISRNKLHLVEAVNQIDNNAKVISSKSFVIYGYEVYEVSSNDEMLAIQIIAHDIKNSIANIKFLTDRENISPQSRNNLDESIKTAFSNSIKLSNFTNLMKINYSSLDIAKFINKILREFTLNNEGIKIESSFDLNYPNILLDEKKFEIVMRNLLQNSVDAVGEESEPAKKEIRIEVKSTESHLKIVIENYLGRELDLEKLKKLGYTTKKTGTGTGLYIARRIIEIMKGSFDISARENKFTVTVKFRRKI